MLLLARAHFSYVTLEFVFVTEVHLSPDHFAINDYYHENQV